MNFETSREQFAQIETARHREAKPFAEGFYYDVFRVTDAAGTPTDKVAKVFTIRDPRRTDVDWETFTRAIEADHAFCVRHFATFVPSTTFVRVPTSDSSKPFEFVALQENYEHAIPVAEYLTGLGSEKMDPETYAAFVDFLDCFTKTLDREGRVPEIPDFLGKKRDLIVDPKTKHVLFLDTNNVAHRGTDHEFEKWQLEVSHDPELKQAIDNRVRIMKKLSAARTEVEKHKPFSEL